MLTWRLQCFTILWQEPGIQALQVLNSEHKWIPAPPIEGTLVIKCVAPQGIVVAGADSLLQSRRPARALDQYVCL